MPSSHLILCRPLLLLPPIPPSISLFQWVNFLHEVAKVLEFQLQHQSFQWTPGLISFRMDWLDLLAVQGTLKSLLQHYNLKASILWHSVFFMVQFSHPYMTTGKTIALTIQTFVDKVMSLLFNTLSRFVIAFLQRSKCLLISWLQSPSLVILESKKIKALPSSAFPPSICHEVMGPYFQGIYNLVVASFKKWQLTDNVIVGKACSWKTAVASSWFTMCRWSVKFSRSSVGHDPHWVLRLLEHSCESENPQVETFSK